MAFLSVVAIDMTLAVDNAVVLGTIAAKLPGALKNRALIIGVIMAAICRILFASFAMKMLSVVGLMLAGGILLLWVTWKLWQEIRNPANEGESSGSATPKSMGQAIRQILIADISMSLDNTLAVAGAARNHFWILVFGLLVSIALTGVAANYVAKIIQRHRWISYVGLAVVLYVSVSMIWEGAHQLL